MKSFVSMVILVLSTVMVPKATSAGQAATPVVPQAGLPARAYLPPASDSYLSGPWNLVGRSTPDYDPSVFADGATASYVGPDGARAVLTAWIAQPGQDVLQQPWAAGVAALDAVAFSWIDVTSTDSKSVADVTVSGFQDCQSIRGLDSVFHLFADAKLCAIGSEAVVLAVYFGGGNVIDTGASWWIYLANRAALRASGS